MKLVDLRPVGQLVLGKRARSAVAGADPQPRRARPRVVFFERDVPYYAENRDLTEIDGGRLVLYGIGARSRPRPGNSSPTPMRRS